MQTNSTIRVAVVGTGQRAGAFAKRLAEMPGVELSGLCDLDAERLAGFAKAHRLEHIFQTLNYEDLLVGERTDAIVLTVPDAVHCQMAVAAFAAGKHVLLEKPMALTEADCRAIIHAKQAAGCVLQVGFVLRCSNFFQKIKSIVDSGCLGQIMSISAFEYLSILHSASYMRRWHRKCANSGSFLLTKCSHDMDMLNWLAGSRPLRVASFGSNDFFQPAKQPATHCSKCDQQAECPYSFKGEFVFMTEADTANPSARNFDLCVYNPDKDVVDNQVCILEYANNIRAMFALQLFRPKSGINGRGITITGSNGYLRAGGELQNLIQVHYADGRPVQVIDASPTNNSGHGGGDAEFIKGFIDSIRNGTDPVADLSDGLASTVVAVALEQARTSGQVVQIHPQQYEVGNTATTLNPTV